MRVLVCGGRDFGKSPPESRFIYDTLRAMLAPAYYAPYSVVVIEGDAPGVDRIAGEWAQDNEQYLDVFPADWNKHGKAAGYIRNKQMLEEGKPDLVIAFPGGRGTANMIKLARDAGVPVEEVVYDG